MAEYSITLPDGTCVEGDAPHYVLAMAKVMRDGSEHEADDEDVRESIESLRRALGREAAERRVTTFE